jgi:Tol biopolymer transport system component
MGRSNAGFLVRQALALVSLAILVAGCGPAPASVDEAPPPTVAVTQEIPTTDMPEPPASTDTALPPAVPTAGLTFSTAEGLWLIDRDRSVVLVVDGPQARLSPDGTKVAFLVEDPTSGDEDVWLLDRVTGDRADLTNTPDRFETVPMWWPGRPDVVVFGSDIGFGMENADYPTVVRLDGSGYQVLDPDHGGPRALSPDGLAIAYGGYDAPGAIYRWGSGIESFDPIEYGVSASKILQPAWSPDGQGLAWLVAGDLERDGGYKTGLAVFNVAAKTGSLMHVFEPAGGGSFPLDVAWSPDGTWIAFVTFGEPPASGRAPNLWAIHPDGSGETYVGEGLNPVWSPDGAHLAFLRTGADGGQEIWMVQTGSWELQQLDLPDQARSALFLMGWVRP